MLSLLFFTLAFSLNENVAFRFKIAVPNAYVYGYFYQQWNSGQQVIKYELGAASYSEYTVSSENAVYMRKGTSCTAYYAKLKSLDYSGLSGSSTSYEGTACTQYIRSDGTKVCMSGTRVIMAEVNTGMRMINIGDVTNTLPSDAISKSGCPAKQCSMKADIAFNVDRSGSIYAADFVAFQNAMKSTVSSLDLGVGKIRVGIIVFDTLGYIISNLETTVAAVHASVGRMGAPGGVTCTACGLEKCQTILTGSTSSFIVATLTDGGSNELPMPCGGPSGQWMVESVRNDCIRTFISRIKGICQSTVTYIAVGCGSYYYYPELLLLADNKAANVLTTAWTEILNAFTKVISLSCAEFGGPPTCTNCNSFCGYAGTCSCPVSCNKDICANTTCNMASEGCVKKAYTCPASTRGCYTTSCSNDQCIETYNCATSNPCSVPSCSNNQCVYTNPCLAQDNPCNKSTAVISGSICRCDITPKVDCSTTNRCIERTCVVSGSVGNCVQNLKAECYAMAICKVNVCYPSTGCQLDTIVCPRDKCGGTSHCDTNTGECVATAGVCPIPPNVDNVNLCGGSVCTASGCIDYEYGCMDPCAHVTCGRSCQIGTCNVENGVGVCSYVPVICPTTDPCVEAYCDVTENACKTRTKPLAPCSICVGGQNQSFCSEPPAACMKVECVNGGCVVSDTCLMFNMCRSSSCNYLTQQCDVLERCDAITGQYVCGVTVCNELTGDCSVNRIPCPMQNCMKATCDLDTYQCAYEDDFFCEEQNTFCQKYQCDKVDGTCKTIYDNTDGTQCQFHSNCSTGECVNELSECTYTPVTCKPYVKDGFEQLCYAVFCNESGECEAVPPEPGMLDDCGYCRGTVPCYQGATEMTSVGIGIIAGIVVLALVALVVLAVLAFVGSKKTYDLISRASGSKTANLNTNPLYEGNANETVNPAFTQG